MCLLKLCDKVLWLSDFPQLRYELWEIWRATNFVSFSENQLARQEQINYFKCVKGDYDRMELFAIGEQ